MPDLKHINVFPDTLLKCHFCKAYLPRIRSSDFLYAE